MIKTTRNYENKYNHLNAEQKLAVDAIEGPVMVIAGPGTGKTQILSVRIGNILLNTDASANNILCLTFTEAAAFQMRSRLVETIGPEGHKAHIFTFHAFCNQIIQENLGYFGNYRQLSLISDLEKIEVFQQILDELPPEHNLRTLKHDPRHEIRKLENHFNLMKKENLTYAEVERLIQEDIEKERRSDKYIAKRKSTKKGRTFVKGDFRDDNFQEYIDKYDNTLEATKLYSRYLEIMDERGLYDYNDMILWVLRAFNDPESGILADYQEQYHYVLVDEYQDTNGAQNDLLERLISFWEESPNVFVVGDDDQAIYKFQGANIENIKEFIERYSPRLVVLEQNYRSNQDILNYSKALIEYNQGRLVNDETLGLKKDLISARTPVPQDIIPEILFFDNLAKEHAYYRDMIIRRHQEGENLGEVAILYRTHKQVAELVDVLEKNHIPINVKKKYNVFNHPLVRNLLKLLDYVTAEYQLSGKKEYLLFEIMHYRFFDVLSSDASKIALYCRRREEDDIPYLTAMSDKELMVEIGITNPDALYNLQQLIEKWTKDLRNMTPQVLFETIINEGNVLKYIFNHPEKTWLLQILNTLFDHLKNFTEKEPTATIEEWLANLDRMKSFDLPLEIVKVTNNKNGVHFITAHSSKGLEFDEVYIMDANAGTWDKNPSTRNQYTMPVTVNQDSDGNNEDERRLFFVAMTRAKQRLTISYALQKKEKPHGNSQFIDEIRSALDVPLTKVDVSNDTLMDFEHDLLLQTEAKIELIDNDLIDRVLEGFKLSVTSLNKYLKCPLSFYFDTILKIPSARNRYMGFGRAIHYAMEHIYKVLKDKQPISKQALIRFFEIGMQKHRSHFTDKEFDDMMEYGRLVLSDYYDENLQEPPRFEDVELEETINLAEYKGIPIKGILDRVDIYKEHVEVTDYKTGNPGSTDTRAKLRSPDERQPNGGDYWRQIVFYKLLLNSFNPHKKPLSKGIIDFVEPDKKKKQFINSSYHVTQDEEDMVGNQIEEVWQKIHNKEFNQLCDDEKCNWCNFVRNDFVNLGDPLDSYEDIELSLDFLDN